MFKTLDGKYYNASENYTHRWGAKAQEKVEAYLEPNEKGFYSIPVDGGKYWTIGTSNGKYGEFAKINGICFSVNKAGFMWAKVGTEKADEFVKAVSGMIEQMKEMKKAGQKESGEE